MFLQCLNVQKTQGRKKKMCVCTEAMMNFHSLLKSTVICAVLHYILSKMS